MPIPQEYSGQVYEFYTNDTNKYLLVLLVPISILTLSSCHNTTMPKELADYLYLNLISHSN